MIDRAAVHELAGGDVTVWLDPLGAIHIKTREPHGDPVELSEDEALQLAELLTSLAAESRG